ncbi:MAG: peptidase [Coriobacteriaceae bacterium]|nr:peptidase [Coriobacteriaceae bacterium]
MSDERLLTTFLDLLRIDSPSGREKGVADYCEAVLRAAGCEVRFDGAAETVGADTGNLFAVLPGTASGRTTVLCAHMDCVQPCEGVEPLLADGVMTSAGETVLGADDKVGLAAVLEAVRRLAEVDDPHPEVHVLLTISEEPGLTGAKALAPDAVTGDVCLVLDADGPVGGIVVASPTHYTFAATFLGKAAHAGVAPEKGSSALVMAARAISAMRLGRLDVETTANIGSVQGGTATNVVAARANVTGECRSLDPERVEEVRQAMQAIMEQAASAAGGRVDVAWTREYTGFRLPEDHPAVVLAQQACRDAGLEPRLLSTGGGSDGNIIAAHGVPTLVLSCGMKDVHGVDESVEVAEIERLTRLVAAVVARMAE